MNVNTTISMDKEKRNSVKEYLANKDMCCNVKIQQMVAQRDKIIKCILCISQKRYKRNPVED